MLTLTLFRHAKSDWDDETLSDFDRPLAKRGLKDAPVMGRAMAEAGIAPDLVLCSTAVRARETWELAAPELTSQPRVEFDSNLYHARPTFLLERLRAVPSRSRHVLMVGHDPGFHIFAREMVAGGPAELVEALDRKFPTAGVAHIGLSADDWLDVAWGSGRLEAFLTPKTVQQSTA